MSSSVRRLPGKGIKLARGVLSGLTLIVLALWTRRAAASVPEAAFNWNPDPQKKGLDWVKVYDVGSERGYHYLGSASIYYRIVLALGQGMLELEGR